MAEYHFSMKTFIYHTTEPPGKWQVLENTPEAREAAIKRGASFFTWSSLSEPYNGNGANPVRFGDMPLDFDNKANPEKALDEMRALLTYHLPELYDYEPEDVSFYCSGCKGFHAVIPAEAFGAEQGHIKLPLIYKTIAQDWVERFNLKTLDMSLYNMKKGKMFRIANVRRINGNFKIPITLDEVQSLTMKDFQELIREPRDV